METFSRCFFLIFIFFPFLFVEQKSEDTIYSSDLKFELDKSPVLAEEIDASNLISVLKHKARENLSLMTNLLAEQELQLWGETKSKETWRYEVAIYDNRQVFRKIESNGELGKEKLALPIPKLGVSPGQEWYDLFRHLAVVPINYQGVGDYKGKRVHVFNYRVFSQDRVCHYTEHAGFLNNWKGFVDCSGQVIVDEQFNIMQIFQELYLPKGRLSSTLYISVNYGLVSLGENQELLRLPISIKMTSQFNNDRKWYFVSGTWKNYRRFRAQSDVAFPQIDTNIIYSK